MINYAADFGDDISIERAGIPNPVKRLLFICNICNQIGSHLFRRLAREIWITKKAYSIPQNYFHLYLKPTIGYKFFGILKEQDEELWE